MNAGKEELVVEQFDSYTKQTFRNRCSIYGANGKTDLVIPVVKDHGKKTLLKDVRIEYVTPWQKTHWRSILSAYASAPFFEYYEDSFAPFYKKQYEFLLDLNMELLRMTLDLLEIRRTIRTSTEFSTPEAGRDLNSSIHPKKAFSHLDFPYKAVPYHQVFSEKHGFIPDLSIMDLLFNEGPNAMMVLKGGMNSDI